MTTVTKPWANRTGFLGVALFVAVVVELGSPRLRIALAHTSRFKYSRLFYVPVVYV